MATLAELTERLAEVLRQHPIGGYSLTLDFKGEGFIRAEGDQVSNSDAPADCILRVSKADFDAVLAGELDPTTMTRNGQLDVIGDPSAALAAQPALMAAWLAGHG